MRFNTALNRKESGARILVYYVLARKPRAKRKLLIRKDLTSTHLTDFVVTRMLRTPGPVCDGVVAPVPGRLCDGPGVAMRLA